jgi:hypothetical protein
LVFVLNKKGYIKMKKLLCAVTVIATYFNAIAMDESQEKSSLSKTTTPAAIEISQVPIVNWERYNPLSPEELAIYKGTWDPNSTLQQNILALTQRFADTCCLFLGGSGDFVLRTPEAKEIRYKKLDQTGIDKVIDNTQKMALNPVGCKLIRLLLTKYLSGDTASKFSKIYIVKGNEMGSFQFGHARCADQNLCILPVSDFSSDGVSMFAGKDVKLAHEIMKNGGSCHVVNGFFDWFFFCDSIDKHADVSLFGAMLRWLHFVSEMDVVALDQSTDAIFKRYIKAGSTDRLPRFRDKLIEQFSDDYFFRCMFGIVYDVKSDAMTMDPLNESAYMITGYGLMRLFASVEEPSGIIEFLRLHGDKEILDFYFNGHAKLPKFGVGQYLCSDIDPRLGMSKV